MATSRAQLLFERYLTQWPWENDYEENNMGEEEDAKKGFESNTKRQQGKPSSKILISSYRMEGESMAQDVAEEDQVMDSSDANNLLAGTPSKWSRTLHGANTPGNLKGFRFIGCMRGHPNTFGLRSGEGCKLDERERDDEEEKGPFENSARKGMNGERRPYLDRRDFRSGSIRLFSGKDLAFDILKKEVDGQFMSRRRRSNSEDRGSVSLKEYGFHDSGTSEMITIEPGAQEDGNCHEEDGEKRKKIRVTLNPFRSKQYSRPEGHYILVPKGRASEPAWSNGHISEKNSERRLLLVKEKEKPGDPSHEAEELNGIENNDDEEEQSGINMYREDDEWGLEEHEGFREEAMEEEKRDNEMLWLEKRGRGNRRDPGQCLIGGYTKENCHEDEIEQEKGVGVEMKMKEKRRVKRVKKKKKRKKRRKEESDRSGFKYVDILGR